MSASRERKQRMAGTDLTEKDRTAAAEAQTAKNKKVMYTALGAVIAVLVAALLIWDSGVFQSAAAKNTVALTVGDKNYTTPYINYFVNGNYQNYRQYGLLSSLDDPYSEEQTWRDYFTENAISSLTQVSILCDEAAKVNYTLTEEDKADVEATIQSIEAAAAQNGMSFKAFLKTYYGDTMTPKLHQDILEKITLANSFQINWMEQQKFADNALNDYYLENAATLDTYTYSSYIVSGAAEATKDADGKEVQPTEAETAAAMAKAKEGADAIAAALKAGSTAYDLATKYDATVSEGVSYMGGSLPADYAEFLQSDGRKTGDVTVIEGTVSYTVLVFEGREDFREVNNYLPANVRHIFLKAEVSDGATAPTDEQMAAAKAKAEQLLSQWKAGEATAASFAALAEANSEDTGSNANGGLYKGISKQTSFIENFLNWTFEDGRKAGDTGIVENTTSNGYHVMYLDSFGEDTVGDLTCLSALQNVAFNDWYEDLKAGYTVTKGDLSYVG